MVRYVIMDIAKTGMNTFDADEMYGQVNTPSPYRMSPVQVDLVSKLNLFACLNQPQLTFSHQFEPVINKTSY